MLGDTYAWPPFLRGADRPRDKSAAAVRAHIIELFDRAVRTERAFVAADASIRRMRRQILVAIFAVRPELQRHGRRAPKSWHIVSNREENLNDEIPSFPDVRYLRHARIRFAISAVSESRIADGVREKRGAGAGWMAP